MSNVPIALELYSVRHDLDRDLRETLEAVAAMGYDGVEFAGTPKYWAEETREALDDAGLECCGWHTPFALVQPDKLAETVEFNQEVGNTRIIVPGIPENLRRTRDDWVKLAEFFNVLAEKLEAHGMVTGYHNHHVEFTELGGETPWDTFFGNTDASVIMQLDTGNAYSGGGDCVEILRNYPGRAGTVHLKPYDVVAGATDRNAGFRPIIGDDTTPWAEVFDLCESIGGTEWYIVEYESDLYPPLEAVKHCLDALRGMGK